MCPVPGFAVNWAARQPPPHLSSWPAAGRAPWAGRAGQMTGGDVFICNVLLQQYLCKNYMSPGWQSHAFHFLYSMNIQKARDHTTAESGDKSYKWYQVIPCSQNNPPIWSPPPAQIPASGGCWHISISNPFNEDSCSSDREMCSLAAISPPPNPNPHHRHRFQHSICPDFETWERKHFISAPVLR